MLIGDEVFADYTLDPSSDPAGSVLGASRAICCSLGGLSKTIGLPQVKLGWIAINGPSADVDALLSAYEVIADTYLSVSTPVQIALPELLVRGAQVRVQIQQRTRRNLNALQQAVRATPEVSLLKVEGGWSATLQVPRYRSEESLVLELLTSDHVLVHPGFFFDFDREAFVVASLLPEPAAFDEGIRRVLSRVTRRGSEA
jgi:aspartate/methionine/tyrosine aminotransferase